MRECGIEGKASKHGWLSLVSKHVIHSLTMHDVHVHSVCIFTT